MREHWSSKVGFILAALGSAIGLGTLWKFPYVTSQNGGGLFVLFYFGFLFLFGMPLFVGELILGRKAQRGAVGIFKELSGPETGWKVIGWLGVASSFLILSYYCVVAGWGLNYLLLSLNQFYETHTPTQISGVFKILYGSGDINLLWAFVFLLMTFGVVYQGLRKGIELWSKVLTISLLCLLLGLCLYATTLEGFGKAVYFLFHPDRSLLKPSGILEALGLSLFTLSLAQGIILTYGSYLRHTEDLPKLACVVVGAVAIVSVLTVLTIFPVIFTFNLPLEGGSGLIFETLPVLFASLPGSMILSTLFFLLFVFTALTSSIALLEVVVANFIDLKQISRRKAVIYASIASFMVGIPSALAGSHSLFKNWFALYGTNFFGTLDGVVSIWLLPIGGFLIVLYIGWHLKKELVKQEFREGSRWPLLFSVWYFIIRWIAPVGILAIFLHQAGLINIDKLL